MSDFQTLCICRQASALCSPASSLCCRVETGIRSVANAGKLTLAVALWVKERSQDTLIEAADDPDCRYRTSPIAKQDKHHV